MMVLGEISLIPPEKGLPNDLRRKMRRLHFSLQHSSERDLECTVLSSDKRHLKTDSEMGE